MPARNKCIWQQLLRAHTHTQTHTHAHRHMAKLDSTTTTSTIHKQLLHKAAAGGDKVSVVGGGGGGFCRMNYDLWQHPLKYAKNMECGSKVMKQPNSRTAEQCRQPKHLHTQHTQHTQQINCKTIVATNPLCGNYVCFCCFCCLVLCCLMQNPQQ